MKKVRKITYDSVLYTVKMRCGRLLYNIGRRLMCEKHDWEDMYNLGERPMKAIYKVCKNCGKKIYY